MRIANKDREHPVPPLQAVLYPACTWDYRGLRTLNARMRLHVENATAIAEHLVDHPAVHRVYYPGLADHPGHDIAARQQRAGGGMLSVELVGGTTEVQAFLEGLRCFSLAESQGGVESLVAHPATMTHAAMAPEARQAAGIGDSLLPCPPASKTCRTCWRTSMRHSSAYSLSSVAAVSRRT